MIRFLEIISLIVTWTYAFFFFLILKAFLPLRKHLIAVIFAFLVCVYLADSIIYSNDLGNLLGTMILFFFYVLIFYRGKMMEKISVLLVFYPALIAVNYLVQDMGGRIFYAVTKSTYEETLNSPELMLISTAVRTISLIVRLLFWIAAYLILRRFLSKIASHLTVKMWLIVDMLTLASFVAIFTIIYFMPEDTAIVYPICIASIFSSFGCMYLASYIYNSMQVSYRAQEMENQRNYYKDRLKNEERIRSIYHDLKNHLLILESNISTPETLTMAKGLREQIADYENYIHTGNEFLDVIIRDKSHLAKEKNIDFNAIVHLDPDCFIEPLDISTVFGNAIDNAIEASEKIPEDMRLVTVKADRIRDMLVITVENNTLTDAANSENTTKEDSFMHGFGIPNIKNAVEKYGGQCSIRTSEGKFLLKILIPYPD